MMIFSSRARKINPFFCKSPPDFEYDVLFSEWHKSQPDPQETCSTSLVFMFQILKPSEKKAKYQYQGLSSGARPVTPRGPGAGGPPGMKRK